MKIHTWVIFRVENSNLPLTKPLKLQSNIVHLNFPAEEGTQQ